ncbi:hypothetical protein ACMT4L_15665 [Deinococcus sp. A31D244]|uniref:hypothetical protein n=1 Tax=Deinococcus sp. A31D244 TaxID=3397675 RepID=UPI0039E04D78
MNKTLSPVKMAIYISIISIILTLLPRRMYSDMISEKNYMYADYNLYLFILLCLLGFISGASLIKVSRIKTKSSYKIRSLNILESRALLLILTLISLLFILKFNSQFGVLKMLALALGNETGPYRLTINKFLGDTNQSYFIPVTLTIITLIYVNMNFSEVKYSNLDKFLYWSNVGLNIICCLVLLNKGPVINLFLVFIVVKILRFKGRSIYSSMATIAQVALVIFAALFAFSALQNSRVSGNSKNPVYYNLIGYFSASYNRASAIMSQDLKYPGQGSSINTLEGVWYAPIVSERLKFAQIGERLGITIPTDGFKNWQQSFIKLRAAGLNEEFNWTTIYGAAFSDYNWYGFLWFVLYGAFAQIIYRYAIMGGVIQISAYVFIIFSMQWWSTAIVFNRDSSFVYILIGSLLVYKTISGKVSFRRREGI